MRPIFLLICILFCACIEESKTETKVAGADTISTTASEIDLEVYDYNGLEPFLNKKDDKTYVVNFWATWCAPCVKELPYFETLNENYKSNNLEVVLVSLDFPKQYDKRLKPFMVKHQLKSKVMALNDTDSNTWINKISPEWTGAIPATLIYNKNKRQFYEHSFNYEQLKAEVEKFIK